MIIKEEILKILAEYYINYKPSLWKNFDGSYESFYKIWKNEHGGYYLKSEIFNPPKKLPKIINNILLIPEIASNDKKFQKEYINKCNKLLLQLDKDIIYLDFRNNYGGKPEIMIAGLLPLFNMSTRKVLNYIKTKNKIIRNIIKQDNCIKSISNNNSIACGTTKKCLNVKKLIIYIDKTTVSAAEESVIALLSLNDIIDISIIGSSFGATSCNKYFNLSDTNGLEIPIGFMTDVNKSVYYNGIKN